MSGAKKKSGWKKSRVILFLVGVCIGIGVMVFVADKFSVRDRDIKPPSSGPSSASLRPATAATVPASAASAPASRAE